MIKETLMSLQLLFTAPNEHECLAKNIYFEARNQSVAGQMAVSHVVMNRVASDRYPNTICGVVEQGPVSRWWKEKHGKTVPIKNKCQFSWFCDGLSDEPKEPTTWRKSLVIAHDAYTLHKLGTDLSEGSMWYHAQNVKPYWRSDFKYVSRIDDHLFYRTKDYKKVNK